MWYDDCLVFVSGIGLWGVGGLTGPEFGWWYNRDPDIVGRLLCNGTYHNQSGGNSQPR